MTTPAEPLTESTDNIKAGKHATAAKWFVVILALTFILRIAYARHLYEDDGLWFTAGEEILRGKALYREIYFDKPPGLALVYAALFWIFGAHILTIRLFTILYTCAVSGVLYKFGSRLYDKRTGLLAAAMFAVFSTTYSAGHFQGLNTDLLMALPYTAGAFLMAGSFCRPGAARKKAARFAVAGGALAGLAFQINPKGALDLVFFAVALWASRRRRNRDDAAERQAGTPEASFATSCMQSASSVRLFCLAAAGFVAASLPFLAYVAYRGSLGSYWFYVWDWGARYGGYYRIGATLLATLSRSAGYFAVNNTLLVTLIFVAASFFRRRRRSASEAAADAADVRSASGATLTERRKYESDTLLLIWFVVSFSGVMLGGRLFPHYFIQILPSLCLIGATGLLAIMKSLKWRSPGLRRAVTAMIAVGFLFTIVRFHGRSALLLADLALGTRSQSNVRWYYDVRNREERLAAEAVTGKSDEESTRLDRVEALRTGGPGTHPVDGSADYLFVWGYRPEIYYWSGLLPASRYLSTQPLTGVPADVHYFGDDYRSLLPEETTAAARTELVRDLEETKPKYIVDELGYFNSSLSIQSYPELREFMTAYKPQGTAGRFFVYIRKEFSKKHRLREARPS